MATASMKDIKRRIKSVESTMQITKAMELVASSKLRKAKARAEQSQPFFNMIYDTMCQVAADPAFRSNFVKESNPRCTLLVVIAGDRGLAGGFNSNILKASLKRAEELKQNSSVKVITIGKKAVEFFAKRDFDVLASYANVAEDFTVYNAQDIAEIIVSDFSENIFSAVELFYTTFVSAISLEPKQVKVLPLKIKRDSIEKPSATIYDPSPEAVFDNIIPKYITGLLYGAVIDSFASEQAARRIAMESASDNAGEMIDSLSLIYNRARQATITQEITEIVAGSKANK